MTTWERLKGLCKHSLTVFWGYLLIGFGMVMEGLNGVSLIVSDPTIVQEVTRLLGASPRALSVFSSVAGVGAIAARMRSIIRDGRAGR